MITWNGHSFDLPVLRYRAMVNRVSAEGLQVRQYFHRYTEDALDLCDVLGSYVPGVKVKLDEVTKILGLPGKPEGIDGSRVEEMVSAGQIEEVARYCESAGRAKRGQSQPTGASSRIDMCAAPFSCVGDPRFALLGLVQFFWFRLISSELRDVLAKLCL